MTKPRKTIKDPPEALYQHLLEIACHGYLQKYVEMIGLFRLYLNKILIIFIEKVNKNYADGEHHMPHIPPINSRALPSKHATSITLWKEQQKRQSHY